MTREAQVSPRHASQVVRQGNQTSFPDDLPSVPVFDRTLPVKQIHVLETLDLLVLRADKGAAPQMAAPRRARWRVAHCSRPQGRWVWGCRSCQCSSLWCQHCGSLAAHLSEGRRVSFSRDCVEQACYGVDTVACIPEHLPTLVCVSDWES